MAISASELMTAGGAGKTREMVESGACMTPEWEGPHLVISVQMGARSKPPGINLGPEECRTRSRGLDCASGSELKERLYSQKNI